MDLSMKRKVSEGEKSIKFKSKERMKMKKICLTEDCLEIAIHKKHFFLRSFA